MIGQVSGKVQFAKRQLQRFIDFSGGKNDKFSPYLLADTEVADIQNFTFDEKGTLEKRRGIVKRYPAAVANGPIRGMHNYRKEDGSSFLIFGADDKLFQDRPNFVQLYDSQGEWETATTQRDGVTTVETAGDIKAVPGTLSALGHIVLGKIGARLGGTRTYRETYWRSNSLDLNGVADKTTGRIVQAVTLSAGTSRTIETRYSADNVTYGAWTALGAGDTIVGVGTNRYLQVRVRFNSTSGVRAAMQSLRISFDQTASATSIATGLSTSARYTFATQNDTVWIVNGENANQKWDGVAAATSAQAGSPPIGKYVLVHSNRMFIAGVASARSRLYFSDIGTPETWPALNFIDVGKGDGDAITGMAVVLDQIVITKDNAIYVLQGDAPSNFVLRKATDAGGAMVMQGFGVVGNTVGWIGKDGVRFFDGVRSVLASEKIEQTFKGLNERQLALAAGVVHDNKYLLSVPEGAAVRNDVILVFDTLRTAWSVFRGIKASEFCIFRQFQADTLLCGSSETGQIYEMDTGYSDDGVAIDAYVVTKAIAPAGGQEAQALVRAVYIGAAEPTAVATTATVSFFKDLGSESAGTTVSLAAQNLNVERVIPSAVGVAVVRTIAVKVRHNVLDRGFNLHSITVEHQPKSGLRAT